MHSSQIPPDVFLHCLGDCPMLIRGPCPSHPRGSTFHMSMRSYGCAGKFQCSRPRPSYTCWGIDSSTTRGSCGDRMRAIVGLSMCTLILFILFNMSGSQDMNTYIYIYIYTHVHTDYSTTLDIAHHACDGCKSQSYLRIIATYPCARARTFTDVGHIQDLRLLRSADAQPQLQVLSRCLAWLPCRS